MDFQLDEIEARVLGALIEKDLATPEYYPLSLNALKNACNQKNNRDPVMSLDEETVSAAIDRLREKRLAVVITGGENRVAKYGHRLSETLNLEARELALLSLLLLRGAQTAGELRGRAESMHSFDDPAAVEGCLRRLMERQPDPLVRLLPKQPGFKELRYAHLLSGDVLTPVKETPAPQRDRLATLETEVAALRAEIADLRRQLAEFRKQFE